MPAAIQVASAHGAGGPHRRETSSKIRAGDEKQLETLSRAIALERKQHPANTSAQKALARFARVHPLDLLGARAALALGYDAYSRKHYADGRTWLPRAGNDPVLRQYALYLSAQTDGQLARPAAALEEWKLFTASYPQSVLLNSALESYARLAADEHQAAVALPALETAPGIATNPALLYWRGRAREDAGEVRAAAQDYSAVYYHFPMNALAHDSGARLGRLRVSLGAEFPHANGEEKLARANALFNAHNWRDALAAYEEAAVGLTGLAGELMEMREARCRAELGAGPAALTGVRFIDPQVDAERLAALTDLYRSAHNDAAMIAAAEAAAAHAPVSPGAADALFTVGNSFWVLLDRDRAASFYDRSLAAAPDGASAQTAAWRAAWAAYLAGRADTSQRFTDFIHNYPNSSFITDAVYWSGRLAERNHQPALARAYYQELEQRFAQSYFGELARATMQRLGSGPVESVALLDEIPALPPAPVLEEEVPAAGTAGAARAQALETISLDSYAEMEYRRIWSETGSPRALLNAAKDAVKGEHYPAAIVLVRQLYPQIEDRKFSDVPLEVWLTGYPVPFLAELRRAAAAAKIDPLIFAGLVRQESAFDPQARSGSGAIGLSQLLPRTAQRIARQLHMRFSAVRLTDPDYNLRIGSQYFADLMRMFGSQEEAVAAYNTGEDHVQAWRANRSYNDTAEFTESIPFSQTHDYVQIVIRNSNICRKLYSAGRNVPDRAQ